MEAAGPIDYPRADMNLPYRLSELTLTPVGRDEKGNYNHAVLRLTDPELYHCPFIMMTEVGALYMDEEEAAHCEGLPPQGRVSVGG